MRGLFPEQIAHCPLVPSDPLLLYQHLACTAEDEQVGNHGGWQEGGYAEEGSRYATRGLYHGRRSHSFCLALLCEAAAARQRCDCERQLSLPAAGAAGVLHSNREQCCV